ncbi:galectin-3-binding protein isoform X2 [Choloepus didactylus]|uniref:galectin-3-binding protein isoform X2 n=1 Tax=Choloepus didactylus TaxID=27675 RepID=UPI00189EAD03|nr:galectin-3-binding protein isoform X2 [Choloepus didactylus]
MWFLEIETRLFPEAFPRPGPAWPRSLLGGCSPQRTGPQSGKGSRAATGTHFGQSWGCPGPAMALPRLFWMWLLFAGTRGAKDGDVRLADGDAPNAGRVEIFHQGQWGTVCDHLWDLDDARVVCRALGFQNASQALGGAAFGPGAGPIMLDEIQCVGDEPSLASCQSLGWLNNFCGHERDAGVVCSNETHTDPSAHTFDLSGELSDALGQIFDNQQGCDLTIQAKVKNGEEGPSLCAHRLILCAHRLILATNPEAQALAAEPGGNVTLSVDAECVPVFRDFIRYLYTRRVTVSLASVKCFHKLASSCGATELQSFCGSLFAILLPQDLSFQTALDLYAYALSTRDALLEELCVQFLAWNFQALTQAEAWPSVPLGLLHVLLPKSELALPSELALLKAVDAWSQARGASAAETEGLLEHIRFPMMQPEELFELQFNGSLFWSHEALFQKKTLQALQFHTVPLRLLAQHTGLNLTAAPYQPRIYTSATWSATVTSGSWNTWPAYEPYARKYAYTRAPRHYGYYPYQSFQTPQHPSFIFRDKLLPWSLVYLPTVQSCWDYGISCSVDELPVLGLSRSGYPDANIGYGNKALMLCDRGFVAGVTDFQDQKALIPSGLSPNSSSSPLFFPCPAGNFSVFRAVIRPSYLTNSTGGD